MIRNKALTQLHLGLGSFHRAHQAVYLQDLYDLGDEQWHIIAGNIRPDMQEVIAALKAQQGVYTLETVTPAGKRAYQQITSIKSVIEWDENLSGLIKVAAAPETRIISFTVTEAGYYLDGDDQLDDSFPDLKTDLAGETCHTLYGAMAVLLAARMQCDGGKLTLLNCDNLRSNGERFYSGLRQFLQRRNALELLAWVDDNTRSPNSMVDRITPRPSPDIRQRVLEATGRDDAAAVMGEAFIQWVIEDDFIAGRPAWEKAGVEMVSDVEPYEEAKIRLLNATHSCFAWAGTLRGHSFIHEGVQDAEIRQLAYDYVTEDAIPCLNTPGSESPLDLEQYRDVVIDRFSNPDIEDTNQRVAMDGYSKIPGFILPTIRETLSAGRSGDAVAILPALFLYFLQCEQQGQIPYQYEDQGMDADHVKAILGAEDVVLAFANDRILFEDVAGNPNWVSALRRAYQRVQVFASSEKKISIRIEVS